MTTWVNRPHGYESTKRKVERVDLLDRDRSETWSVVNWAEIRAALKRDEKANFLKCLKERNENLEIEPGDLQLTSYSGPSRHTPSTNDMATSPYTSKDTLVGLAKRDQWKNSLEFLLSIISMVVGIGTFYRFPYVVFKNGGGAFIFPYIVVVFLIGRPLYFMELCIGQFCSYGQVKIWDVSPLFRGVGYGSAIANYWVLTYYIAIMGTMFYYLFSSFQETLPWTWCNPEWAGRRLCEEIENITRNDKTKKVDELVNLPQLYFDNAAISGKEQIDDGIGIPQRYQTGCLLVSYILVYIIIAGGVKSSGKASYVLTIYPFTVIIIVLIVACTKPGAGAGMLYFITPVWKKMLEGDVWFAAAGQCFFTLAIGFGPIINYASFNPFHEDIYRVAFIVSVMDTMAGFLAGLTVFAILGSVSKKMNKPIEDVVADGPGLVLVTFSGAIKDFDYFPYSPQLLSFLFFSMIISLAAGSAAACQLAVVSVICDDFPKLSTFWMTVVLCVVGFGVSLIYVTPGGYFMGTLVDYFAGNLNIYFLCILECIGINWVYGLRNFARDVEFMLNRKLSWYWKICWGFVVPVMLTVVLCYSLLTSKRLEHNKKPFPLSAIVGGWLLTGSSIAFIPIIAIITVWKKNGTLKQRFLASLKPTESYGPRNPVDRKEWELCKKQFENKGQGGDGDAPNEENDGHEEMNSLGVTERHLTFVPT